MSLEQWETLYRNIRKPRLKDTITGFNINLDRIIPVTGELLASSLFHHPDLSNLRERLMRLMQYCTAEEWHIADPEYYHRITRYFRQAGSRTIGGQAGIAAIHLSKIGVKRVVCAAPHHGRESAAILKNQGIIVPEFDALPDNAADHEHLVFEYPPGLVPLAEGVTPRNNRLIVSPVHKSSSALVPERCMARFLSDIASCERAFLSGFQYLISETDFSGAAGQIGRMKNRNPSLRVHIEWVSIRDNEVLERYTRHILPCADSLGLNENELRFILGQLRIRESHSESSETGSFTPLQVMHGALELCRVLDLKRLHVHTFGYYILIIRGDTVDAG
ncbi:MAG: ADP-dependent glucokinase/phosphofructokinase, partial [Methanoregula sp.]|nr:ADP-dependent glucokinase/phosphofructokinase [Methanoregula sp.]